MSWHQIALLLVTIACMGVPMLYAFSIKEKEMHPNVKGIQNTQALRIENAKLRIENAKLHELARIMAYCMHDGRECDQCAMNGADMNVEVDQLLACDGLYERLMEMGIDD